MLSGPRLNLRRHQSGIAFVRLGRKEEESIKKAPTQANVQHPQCCHHLSELQHHTGYMGTDKNLLFVQAFLG